MFINETDVKYVAMNDDNVTDVLADDKFGAENDSRLFDDDVPQENPSKGSPNNMFQKPLPGFFQVNLVSFNTAMLVQFEQMARLCVLYLANSATKICERRFNILQKYVNPREIAKDF